ncbi:hypothetical protein A4G18_02885 [Pasteurellaceae bacterium Pebbles2]|nr:hypothetical protein [Pasteurellaceae bacterium Pebbles2]
MKKAKSLAAVIVAAFLMTGCAGSDNTSVLDALQGQLSSAINDSLSSLTRPVKVDNLTHMTHETRFVDGKDYVYLSFYSSDNKIYRMRTPADKITNEQLERLGKLKSATLIGPIPVTDQPNVYSFRGFQK